MIDSFDDIDNIWCFDNTEYVDNADAVPPSLDINYHPTSTFPLYPTTTVSVLTLSSILPASRGYRVGLLAVFNYC